MDDWTMLGQVIVAALLGAVLGFERELARKPAGLRTHMLVAGAAALIVLVGQDVLAASDSSGDPTRALHAVVTGIGFIGAGTILHDRGQLEVSGLTTAATLFMAAAVGIAVASEAWIPAFGITMFFAISNPLLHWVERVVERRAADGS